MPESKNATSKTQSRAPSKIEAGIDAVVVGATVEGLAAASYLGKAGFKTVLLEAGASAGAAGREREFAPGYHCADGEHLLSALDPELVSDFDLYRFGLSFSNRCLDTVYYFDDGAAIRLDGEPQRWKQSLSRAGCDEIEPFGDFMEMVLETAALLRSHLKLTMGRDGRQSKFMVSSIFSNAPPERVALIERFLFGSTDDVLDGVFKDPRLQNLIMAESSLRMAAAPHDAFSFLALVHALSGEVAGLQGARAYVKGGIVGVVDALRRAAQAKKVDIRAAASVKSVIVEWDRIAGVELVDGTQIRTPIVVNALDARSAFVNQIGFEKINLEFQHVLDAPTPKTASARIHFALRGAPADQSTKANLSRRLVLAPSRTALRHAYHSARSGKVSAPLIIEAVFPSAFDEKAMAAKKQVLSIFAHPIPYDENPSENMRAEIMEAAIRSLELIMPGVTDRIEASELRLPADIAHESGVDPVTLAARPLILEQWARAQLLIESSGIEGFYFCGPEAQIGVGVSGAAGRVAAKAAMDDSKSRARFL